ncbi:MAG: PLDc N-terminal domain-containing protein [Candidatus Pacearchaeota archaeon]
MAIFSFAYFDNFFVYGILIGIVAIAFWLWMLIDCANRKFKRSWEKIAWILIIVILGWIGAFIYLILVPIFNQKGILKR